MKASKKSQWGGAAKKKQKVVPKKKNDKEEETKKKSSNNRDRIVDWEHVLGRSSSVVLPLTTGELDDAPPEEEEEEAYERRVWRKMSKIDRYKCAVFKDLHEKGFTMTSAAKFGGDYLAYPGDPMLFHAYFTVRVLERGEKMTPLSCSSVTRMAHAARKNVVFAFCGEEEDEKGGDNKNNNNDGVLRIQYFTCVPDIELSSNRGF
jgi:tRNA-splicing endonuclease subunit Sen34